MAARHVRKRPVAGNAADRSHDHSARLRAPAALQGLYRKACLRGLTAGLCAVISDALLLLSGVAALFGDCAGWVTLRVADFCGVLVSVPGAHHYTFFGQQFGLAPVWLSSVLRDAVMISGAAPAVLVGILIYHLLSFGRPRDSFTRCGTCGYILRGLTVPRCPECGRDV